MLQPPDDLPDDQIEVWQQSLEYFHRAHRHQYEGDLASAMQDCRSALALYPTAEAHTFLGALYAIVQLLEKAIAECKAAIAINPEYGNPYNDIGTYLVRMGKPREAILWFERACQAPRFEARAQAWFNLGIAHERLGNWQEALQAYERSDALPPHDAQASHARIKLLAKFN